MSAINLHAHCRIVVTSNDVATAHVRHDFHGIVETKRSYQFDQTLYRVGGRGLACETIGEIPKRLEKVVASKQLRLAVETEEERRARLENDAATKRLRLAMEMDKERKARLEKIVATTELMFHVSPD